MTKIRANIVKNATCLKCGEKLHRRDFYTDVTRQHVDIIATCPNPACKHTFVYDRVHRESVRSK